VYEKNLFGTHHAHEYRDLVLLDVLRDAFEQWRGLRAWNP
jgi:hypothetical protein